MTDMERLVAFVLARIAEDEAAARSAKGRVEFHVIFDDEQSLTPQQVTHILRHDPARVLAEVEAKRRIVELHEPDGPWCRWSHSAEYTHADMGGLCETLRLLAQPHAGADGWDETWKV